jgi:erythromycin esterase
MRYFGGVIAFWPAMKNSTAGVRLGRQYDALAYIERTTRARPNP